MPGCRSRSAAGESCWLHEGVRNGGDRGAGLGVLSRTRQLEAGSKENRVRPPETTIPTSTCPIEKFSDLSLPPFFLRAERSVTSYQIDLKSHKLTTEWDGHRRFSPQVWRILCGARPNMINRRPLSVHRALLESCFDVTEFEVFEREPNTPVAALAPNSSRWAKPSSTRVASSFSVASRLPDDGRSDRVR